MTKYVITSRNLHNKTVEVSLTEKELTSFQNEGYLGPYSLFEPDETKEIFESCFKYPRLLLPWSKGRHLVVRKLANIARHPIIVQRLIPLLGQNVLLWGSMLIRQPSYAKHPFHVDLEHNQWNGISVWIGMQNVVSGSSVSVISGSHLFDVSPQELRFFQKLDNENEMAVLEAARKINPNSQLRHLPVIDGQFIIFSGRLWHGTSNPTKRPRKSILLQFTTPEQQVRIAKSYTVPQITWLKKKPTCLLISGENKDGVNIVNIGANAGVLNFIRSLFLYLPNNAFRILRSYFSK